MRIAILAVTVGFVGCSESPTPPGGGPPNGVCYAELCTDDNLDALFARVSEKLAEDGQPVDRDVWDQPILYTAVFARMQQVINEGTQTSTTPTTTTSSVAHCGPGLTQMPGKLVHPGACLNTVCLEHRGCYTAAAVPSGCAFSSRASSCDDPFFAGYEACVADNKCELNCRITAAIARSLNALPGACQ